jgi:hypothetical protein
MASPASSCRRRHHPLPALQAQLAARPEFAALSARVEAAADSDGAAAQRHLPELTVGVGGKQRRRRPRARQRQPG